MKDNTYIIPAIKFFIVNEPEELKNKRNFNNYLLEFQRKIDISDITLIPFDQVDGITVAVMQEALNINKYFAVMAALDIEQCHVYGGNIISNRKICNLKTIVFPIKEDILDTPVDKVFENYIENSYFSVSENERMIYNSFLEKYRYQDYNKTKEKVKQIEKNRK